jgi:hypothetical protein
MAASFIRLRVKATGCEQLAQRPSAVGDKLFVINKSITTDRLLQSIKHVMGIAGHETPVFSVLGMATTLEDILTECKAFLLENAVPFFPLDDDNGVNMVTIEVITLIVRMVPRIQH